MKLVLDQNERVGAWASEKFGRSLGPPYVAMGVVDDDGILHGAIIFNNYNQTNIEVSIVGGAVLHRKFIRAAFRYAFDQLKVLRITARTKRSNKNVSRILCRLGFIYEGTLKSYFGPLKGDDAIMYRLGRLEASRWIGEPTDAV